MARFILVWFLASLTPQKKLPMETNSIVQAWLQDRWLESTAEECAYAALSCCLHSSIFRGKHKWVQQKTESLDTRRRKKNIYKYDVNINYCLIWFAGQTRSSREKKLCEVVSVHFRPKEEGIGNLCSTLNFLRLFLYISDGRRKESVTLLHTQFSG